MKGTFMSPRGPHHARPISRTFSRTLFAGGRLMNSVGLSPKSAACRLLLAAGALAASALAADAATPKHKYTFNQGNANDSLGGMNGVVVDNTGISSYTGGALDLSQQQRRQFESGLRQSGHRRRLRRSSQRPLYRRRHQRHVRRRHARDLGHPARESQLGSSGRLRHQRGR